MGENPTTPGPDPSTLRNADSAPPGVTPIPMRVTYKTDSPSDWISVEREGYGVRLMLAGPLLSVVRKVGQVNDFKNELSDALNAVGIELISEFTEAVAEYANILLPVEGIPLTIGLGTAAYLLKRIHTAGVLALGFIHHASIEELPSWMGMIEKAKQDPDITVT